MLAAALVDTQCGDGSSGKTRTYVLRLMKPSWNLSSHTTMRGGLTESLTQIYALRGRRTHIILLDHNGRCCNAAFQPPMAFGK